MQRLTRGNYKVPAAMLAGIALGSLAMLMPKARSAKAGSFIVEGLE